MTVFISYSGDRVDRAELVYSLREHGVTPWRDVENLDIGAQTTDAIESELALCSGILLWVNEAVLSSAYVADVELPAIARAARERDTRIAPVFDGMSPSDAADRVSQFGIEIGDQNGFVVDATASARETAAAIAAAYVSGEVRSAHRSGRAPIVRLVTYDDTAAHRDDAVLNFDWRHLFADTTLGPGIEERLQTALAASTGGLKAAYGATEFALAVKAHIPAAMALGHAFAEPTGCSLRMEREGVMYVTSRARVDDVAMLRAQAHPKGPIESRAAAIEVPVTRATEAGVGAYIAQGHRYRERLELLPPGGSSRYAVRDDATCNAWGYQIGDLLAQMGARPDIDRVDLFLACPVELAVAIGWWANATGPIEILNWSGKSGPYSPMWHLPAP